MKLSLCHESMSQIITGGKNNEAPLFSPSAI